MVTRPGPDAVVALEADVAVVGGGLVGLAFAIACAQSGIETISIDRLPTEVRADEPFDGRAFAIAYGSKKILEGIGVWPLVEAHAEPIREIRVVDQNAPLFLHYDHREVGSDALGWMIESRHLRQALARRVAELPALRHLAPHTVTAIERTSVGAQLTLDDSGVVRARLVAAADGRDSGLRREAGIKTATWQYGQDAIVCTVAHERPHHGIAVEHFLASGPFAILPLSGNRSSIVWTEKAALVPALMALGDAAFRDELARRFGDFLGAADIVGPRFSYPVSVVYAQRMSAPRLALLGDAAHGIHPIAGQGLNLGIRDVGVLAELAVDACRLGLDPGNPGLLARYERLRRIDTIALTAVTDGLNRLFSNDLTPLKWARDIGLAAVGTAPLAPVRKALMRHAMGLSGKQPRLVRGEAL